MTLVVCTLAHSDKDIIWDLSTQPENTVERHEICSSAYDRKGRRKATTQAEQHNEKSAVLSPQKVGG